MKWPEIFVVKGKPKLVYKLKIFIYGLMQSLKIWYHNFDMYIQGLGFLRSQVDHYVYLKSKGRYFIYVVLYFDSILLVGNNMGAIRKVKM